MDNSIFRKKSIERISSPEQLGDYIRVSNPSVWIILGAIIVLLAGACVWGIFGTIETRVSAPVVSDGESIILYLDEEEIKTVNVGMEAVVEDKGYKIISISQKPVQIGRDFDPYVLHIGGFSEGQWIYQASVSGNIPVGIYEASIVTERISPMSFVLN